MPFANPSHSTEGSNASEGSVSPAQTVSLRRMLLSAVDWSPVPHSLPGSTPTWPSESTTSPLPALALFLRRTRASSPLKLMVPVLVTSQRLVMPESLALQSTSTSPSAMLPVRARLLVMLVEPFEYSSSRYWPESRSTAAPVPL